MYNKKYCNTLCCNNIRRVVKSILLTPNGVKWAKVGFQFYMEEVPIVGVHACRYV